MIRARLSVLLLGVLGSCALARPAHAYVRYQVVKDGEPTGVYQQWRQSCIPVFVYPNDLADQMSVDEIEQAVSGAAAAWSLAQIDGTFMDVQVSASFDATPLTGSDKYHDVVFKNPWCDPGDTTCTPEALAITSVWAGQVSGTIVDADIEVNAQYVVWTDWLVNPGAAKQDLQNALTHEMGHLVGLDHNCHQPSDPYQMTDSNGVLVPPCLGASAETQADVMYYTSGAGDTSKRTLKPDDIQAMLDIYPVAKNPHVCPPPGTLISTAVPGSGCHCAVDSTSSAGGLLPALALLAGVATRARRRRGR